MRSFTTRPCRSVPFRCYDEKYYFRFLIWLEILLFYLEQRVCLLQRRAESPIENYPWAAPWVTVNYVICDLKEQKEVTNEYFTGSFCAYSAQLVNYRSPRALPWAVFLLGLRPVLARNHGCYCSTQYSFLFMAHTLRHSCSFGNSL